MTRQQLNDHIDRLAVTILSYAFVAWRHIAVLPGIAKDLYGDLKRKLSGRKRG